MDLDKYLRRSEPFEVELRGGVTLKGTYRPNYLNEAAIKHIYGDKGEEEGSPVIETYESYIDLLVYLIDSVDMKKGGKKIPFSTDKEKRAALSHLAMEDLALITRGILDMVSTPLEETGTDS